MERTQQPGSLCFQADFYVFRAEAFIQLCDFSSALQNLRRAYTYQPENSKYLERLAFVLYLQVPKQLPPTEECIPHTSHRPALRPVGWPPATWKC